MLPASGGSTDRLEIPPDARVERLQRRAAALERQLEARIAQVDELRDRLAEQERLAAAAKDDAARARAEAEALRPEAAEYEALMQTFTMRALSRPRSWYASARSRLARP